MRDLIATAALAPGRVVVSEAVSIEVLPASSHVRLQRSKAAQPQPPIEVLGTRLPTEPGRCSGVDPVAWWLSPATWLIASARCSGTALVAAVESARGDGPCALVDVSDSFTALEIRGRGARELLARGTGFDVRAARFGPGCGTRLAFAQLPVLLRVVAEDRFELLVERGAARWLTQWLSAAAASMS